MQLKLKKSILIAAIMSVTNSMRLASSDFPRRDAFRTRRPGTPKTPVFGLPKSRPSPLQKTPFFALSEAKSVHF
jgi:hypothetical protein